MLHSLFPDLEPAPEAQSQRFRLRAPRRKKVLPPPMPLLLDALPVATPRKLTAPAPYPLDGKDPFGEFANCYDWQLHDVPWQLERLPHDYDASIAYIRAYRPRESGPALQFWLAPLSRAHLLNALLLRADRTLAAVQSDLDIQLDKIYSYLPRWGIEFKMTRRDAMIFDAAGRSYPATVESWDRIKGTAVLRLDGYMIRLTGRYDKLNRVYRVGHTIDLDLDTLIPYSAAALLANLTEAGLKRCLPPEIRSNAAVPLISLRRFSMICPRHVWRTTLEEALSRVNGCGGCMFFDYHASGCGLKNPLPAAGTAEYACTDWEA